MKAKVTIMFAVATGYLPGDYAKLCGNGGAGDVDYDTPLDATRHELFPRGAGNYGFGHAPFGHFRFGHSHSVNCPGFGSLPFGHFPFGHGTAIVTATTEVDECGTYKFGFAVFDELGNPQTGTPDEVTLDIHVAPAKPSRLTKSNYNKTTDVLTLDV